MCRKFTYILHEIYFYLKAADSCETVSGNYELQNGRDLEHPAMGPLSELTSSEAQNTAVACPGSQQPLPASAPTTFHPWGSLSVLGKCSENLGSNRCLFLALSISSFQRQQFPMVSLSPTHHYPHPCCVYLPTSLCWISLTYT